MKIGIVFGNPETTTGGNALKFYSSVRLEIRRTKKIDSGTGDAKESIGNSVKVKVVKNKVAAPFKIAEFDIMFNEGISQEGDMINVGVANEVLKKAGAFYSYGEIKLGQGMEKSKQFLRDNPEVYQDIQMEVFKKVGLEKRVEVLLAQKKEREKTVKKMTKKPSTPIVNAEPIDDKK